MGTYTNFRSLVRAVFDKQYTETPPLVEVLWLDATDIAESWGDADSLERAVPAPSLSVGYLLESNKDCVKIIPMVNEDHFANGVVIPNGMVQSINYLTRTKKK